MAIVLLVAAGTFFRGLDWGLPSRDSDRWLFGGRPAWSGAEIVELLRDEGGGMKDEVDPSSLIPPPSSLRGADVDADPIVDRSRPVVLNATDRGRAEIVQRYRLMSGQPDEFIQFKALAEMSVRPGLGKLDPRLYQYGGLWIYPVGGLVRAAMAVGYIPTPPAGVPAREFYLDRPDAFGKFYVVARAYSATWGVVAALAVFALARGITRRASLGAIAAIAFVALPVTQTAAHEAKPHLAGAAMCLLAVIAATRHVETGGRRWLITSGALCGAAAGMVVSMALAVVVLPVAVWLRPSPSAKGRWAALISSVASAAIVYAAANPFVLINAVAAPQLLRSNLGNSTAMYGVGGIVAMLGGAVRVAEAGLSFAGLVTLFWIGVFSLFAFARSRRPLDVDVIPLGLVALTFALLFVALAAGKPAEYARFGLLPAAAACVSAAVVWARRTPRERFALLALAAPMAIVGNAVHIARAPRVDATALAKRVEASEGRTLHLHWPPAPWSCPPVNLFDTHIVLDDLRDEPDEPAGSLRLFPTNLGSTIGESSNDESCDWRRNHFVARPRN